MLGFAAQPTRDCFGDIEWQAWSHSEGSNGSNLPLRMTDAEKSGRLLTARLCQCWAAELSPSD